MKSYSPNGFSASSKSHPNIFAYDPITTPLNDLGNSIELMKEAILVMILVGMVV